MPDSRKHRGQHPSDAGLFGESQVPKLQQAVRDLSWLLSRGYAEKSSLRLVGDRYRLQSRQRLAVARSSCSRQAASRWRLHALPEEAMRGNTLFIDGFNLLITLESALSGGFILEGVDGCYRDMASIHGSYKRAVRGIPLRAGCFDPAVRPARPGFFFLMFVFLAPPPAYCWPIVDFLGFFS